MQLQTNRLLIRPLLKDDAEAVFAYRSDAETNRYQGFIPETVEDVLDFFETKVCRLFNRPDTWYQLIMIEKEGQTLIGDIGIHFIDEKGKEVELGITLSKKRQGKGFATEALKTVIGFLFSEMKKQVIVARVDPQNLNSIRLLERLGFDRKESSTDEYLYTLSSVKTIDAEE